MSTAAPLIPTSALLSSHSCLVLAMTLVLEYGFKPTRQYHDKVLFVGHAPKAVRSPLVAVCLVRAGRYDIKLKLVGF